MANASMDRPPLRGHAFWVIWDMRNAAGIAAVGTMTATGSGEGGRRPRASGADQGN